MSELRSAPQPPVMVFWIIWFAILSGLFVMAFVGDSGRPQGGTGIPPKPESWSMISLVALILGSLGILCRWVILPRMKSLQAKLPIMIFGLALCEACGIIGIFVVDHQLPREQLLLFWMAVGGVLVSAPIYTVLKTKPSPFRES